MFDQLLRIFPLANHLNPLDQCLILPNPPQQLLRHHQPLLLDTCFPIILIFLLGGSYRMKFTIISMVIFCCVLRGEGMTVVAEENERWGLTLRVLVCVLVVLVDYGFDGFGFLAR